MRGTCTHGRNPVPPTLRFNITFQGRGSSFAGNDMLVMYRMRGIKAMYIYIYIPFEG